MRPIEEWADLKYAPGTHEAHIFPWGDHRPLCNGRTFFEVFTGELRGTGSWEEFEHALSLPLCQDCHAVVDDTVPPAPAELPAWCRCPDDCDCDGRLFLPENDPAVVEWSEALGVEL